MRKILVVEDKTAAALVLRADMEYAGYRRIEAIFRLCPTRVV